MARAFSVADASRAVVEVEDMDLLVVSEALRQDGWGVVAVTSADEASGRTFINFDVVLCDIPLSHPSFAPTPDRARRFAPTAPRSTGTRARITPEQPPRSTGIRIRRSDYLSRGRSAPTRCRRSGSTVEL